MNTIIISLLGSSIVALLFLLIGGIISSVKGVDIMEYQLTL